MCAGRHNPRNRCLGASYPVDTIMLSRLTAVPDEKHPMSSRDSATVTRAALRVAGRKTGESRLVRALYRAGTVTTRNVAHVLHALWLEVTGFFFLVLAFIGVTAAIREYRRHLAGTASVGKICIAVAFAVLFAYFGVSSFWRTRKKK